MATSSRISATTTYGCRTTSDSCSPQSTAMSDSSTARRSASDQTGHRPFTRTPCFKPQPVESRRWPEARSGCCRRRRWRTGLRSHERSEGGHDPEAEMQAAGAADYVYASPDHGPNAASLDVLLAHLYGKQRLRRAWARVRNRSLPPPPAEDQLRRLRRYKGVDD